MKKALTALVLCTASSSVLAQSFEIVDLGSLSSNPAHAVRAVGINNRGEVHGSNELNGAFGTPKVHSFFWDGALHHIYPLVPTLALPGDLNDRSQVVGYATAGPTKLHGYLWEAGSLTDIYAGTLDFSHANDISRDGWVVGTNSMLVWGQMVAPFRAYLREPSGAWSDLGTLGGHRAFGLGLNERLDVVGTSDDTAGQTRGFFKPFGGSMVDLGSLVGGFVSPRAINDAGLVVGIDVPPGAQAGPPALWSVGGLAHLPTLGGASGIANSVNASGEVVGSSLDGAGVQRATLWSSFGSPVDLNTLIPAGLGWDLDGAAEINDLGEICGTATLAGNKRAYRLSPVLSAPRISGFQPAIAGRDAALFGIGFAPGATVFVVYALAGGATPVPGCAGQVADMAAPTLLTAVTADASGRIEFSLGLPAAASGITLRSLAVDLAGCGVSDVVIQAVQ